MCDEKPLRDLIQKIMGAMQEWLDQLPRPDNALPDGGGVNRPDNSLPGVNRPDNTLPGSGGVNRPDNTLPGVNRPDNTLPGKK
jgi:hypothetical protein